MFSVLGTMVRRKVVEELNGFDPEFAYMEDYELWLRAIRSHRIAFLEFVCGHYSLNRSGMVCTTPRRTKAKYAALARQKHYSGHVVRQP